MSEIRVDTPLGKAVGEIEANVRRGLNHPIEPSFGMWKAAHTILALCAALRERCDLFDALEHENIGLAKELGEARAEIERLRKIIRDSFQEA